MLKWIEIIASFFIGRMQSNQGPSLRESALAIFDEITYKSRKAVSLIVVSFGAAIFALGGFFISLINATTQYDRDGGIAFTATFASGLVLIVLAIATFSWVFRSAWPGVKKAKHSAKHMYEAREREERFEHEHAQQKQPSSLEQALSALVMDFVHERQSRRAEAQSPLTPEEQDFSSPSMTRYEDSASPVSMNQTSGMKTTSTSSFSSNFSGMTNPSIPNPGLPSSSVSSSSTSATNHDPLH